MPQYELRVSSAARRALARLPISQAAAVVELMCGDLLEAPHRVGKPLHDELAGRYCARRGMYRVIYLINDEANTIEVERIDHRADIYRPR